MAQNPYVNKVVLGNDTLLDLTEDSVTENTLLEGETAHKASGEPITGTAKQGHVIWNAIKTALSPQRLKLWFADAKVTDDSTEQATKVEVVQLIDDESELTNAPDGVYQGDYDDVPEDVLDASMVAYKDGSVEDALDKLTQAVVTGTLANITGAISVAYPSGFTRDNCYALSFEVYAGDAWRAGEGFYASSFSRTYYVLGASAIQIYNDNSLVYNLPFRLILAKL